MVHECIKFGFDHMKGSEGRGQCKGHYTVLERRRFLYAETDIVLKNTAQFGCGLVLLDNWNT